MKLSALTKVAKFVLFKNRRILFKALELQFQYWTINDKINKLYERALRIVYNDTVTSLENLLIKDKSFAIHHRNIQSLAMKIYKAIHNFPGGNLSGFFVKK